MYKRIKYILEVAKKKVKGVFGKLLKTFAAPILDILPIWEERITM